MSGNFLIMPGAISPDTLGGNMPFTHFEQELRQHMQDCELGEDLHQELIDYIMRGALPGSLRGALENNLRQAVIYADQVHLFRLHQFILFLVNYCPTMCWGSEEKVARWLEHRGLLEFIATEGHC